MIEIRKSVESYLSDHIALKNRVELGIIRRKDDVKMNEIICQVKAKYEGTNIGRFIILKWELGYSDNLILSLMHINQRTFYIMHNKIINEVTLLAAKKQLVKPF